ncbi:MAG TPA: ABC transporter substrate-binding protein [Thermoanaerobaculia bacterium]|nr:ABC transporter substrate-binding protein [Thermoanaerobaculia bacterium]
MLASGLFALAADCGGGDSAPPTAGALDAPTKVQLQLNWKPEPQFGGFYAAQVTGAYARHGLEVAIRPGGASAPTVDMLGAGTVPFAIVSGDEIVRARANGNLLVGLFAAYQTNPQGIMTRASRGFTTLADVFAHPGTLAMERGLPYSRFLERKYGFEKLRIVPSPFGDLSLFRTDPHYSMQCFVTAEPLQARRIGIEPQTFLVAESGYNPYTTVLTTSESYLGANRATVEAMVEAVREGWQAYLADPTATNELMHRLNPTMDARTFAESAAAQQPLIEGEGGDRSSVGAMTLERWRTLVDQLVELGVIFEPVPAEQCFVDLARSP